MKTFISGIGLIILGFISISSQRVVNLFWIAGGMRISGGLSSCLLFGVAAIVAGIILCIVSVVFARKKGIRNPAQAVFVSGIGLTILGFISMQLERVADAALIAFDVFRDQGFTFNMIFGEAVFIVGIVLCIVSAILARKK